MAGVPAVFRTRHLPNINSGRYLYAYVLSKSAEYAQYRTVNVVLCDTNRSHELRKVHTLTVFCVLRNYLLHFCVLTGMESVLIVHLILKCLYLARLGRQTSIITREKAPQFMRFLSRNSSHKRMTTA